MAVGQGWNSWGSVKEIATWGTVVGGARQGYFRTVDGINVDPNDNLFEAPGNGDRSVRALYPGRRVLTPTIPLETNFEGGWLYFLKHLLGGYSFTVNTPVAGVNLHAFSCAANLPLGLDVELSLGDIPTNQVNLLASLKVNTGEFSLSQDSLLAAQFGCLCRDFVPGTARIAGPTFPADKHIKSVHYNPSYAASLATLAGSNIATLQSFRITFDNKIEGRYNLGRYTAEPVPSKKREITIECVADFEDLTLMNKFLNNTTGGCTITLTGDIITGATRQSIVFTAPTSVLTGAPLSVPNEGPITVPFKARAIGASEFSVAIFNAQATL